MRISCPNCGQREEFEFHFDRVQEGVIDPRGASANETVSLYDRTNPRGMSLELWQHTSGCRSWLLIERHTLTHEIAKVTLASERM